MFASPYKLLSCLGLITIPLTTCGASVNIEPDTIAFYQMTIKTLTRQVTELTANDQDKEATMKNDRQQYEEDKQQLRQQSKKQLKEQGDTIYHLNTTINQQTKEIEQQRDTICHLNTTIDQQAKKIKKQDATIKKQGNTIKQQHEHIQQQEVAINLLQERVQAHEAQNQQLQQAHEEHTVAIEQLQQQMHQFRASIEAQQPRPPATVQATQATEPPQATVPQFRPQPARPAPIRLVPQQQATNDSDLEDTLKLLVAAGTVGVGAYALYKGMQPRALPPRNYSTPLPASPETIQQATRDELHFPLDKVDSPTPPIRFVTPPPVLHDNRSIAQLGSSRYGLGSYDNQGCIVQ